MTTLYFSISKVSNGRARLQSDRTVAVKSPSGRTWELYVVGDDGIEMFQRYANENESKVLSLASKDPRGYSLVSF